jgi:hypothetical protein
MKPTDHVRNTAPQTTGVFQPSNWHHPGIAVKGDDALKLSCWLYEFADIIEKRDERFSPPMEELKTYREKSIRRMADIFGSCCVEFE